MSMNFRQAARFPLRKCDLCAIDQSMETSVAVDVLAALAQETRLTVVRELVSAGPEGLPAGEISGRLGVGPTTLTFHLKELQKAGLLRRQRRGRYIFYALERERLDRFMAFLADHCFREAPARLAVPLGLRADLPVDRSLEPASTAKLG